MDWHIQINVTKQNKRNILILLIAKGFLTFRSIFILQNILGDSGGKETILGSGNMHQYKQKFLFEPLRCRGGKVTGS